jgi:hypothetical protein
MLERYIECRTIHARLSTRNDFHDYSVAAGVSPAFAKGSVTSRNDIGALDHQDYRSFRRACAMAHTLGHDETLPRRKIDNAIFEIDQKTPVQNEKEFINILMLVPVIFALNYRQPHDRIVHLAKCLVVPFVGAGISQLPHIDQFKRSVQNVEVSFVREIFSARSRIHIANLTAEHTEVAEKTRRIASAIFAFSAVQ